MGRRSHTRALSVWANGLRVGVWRLPAHSSMEFIYDADWMASPAGRPLSLSLPFVANAALKGERVRNYFDNLLPDSEHIRTRLATRFRTASVEAFDLLQAIGRDCVGAIQLLGENETPSNIERIDATPLTEEDVERLLEQTTSSRPVGEEDGGQLRISLAGAQEKTALLWNNDRWQLPRASTPTTHILKLPLGLVGHIKADFQTSVENEWLCLNLLAEIGLPVAKCAILNFGRQKVLAVERFDRQWHSSGNWLLRLPQEDFCQVFGVPSHLKYEVDGGPGATSIAAVLSQSVTPKEDLATLLTAQILFWMMMATDGHAKNFSIHLLPESRYRLTPLYDVMSFWPVEGDGPSQMSQHKAKLAMAVLGKGRHYLYKSIQRRHFNNTAALCLYGGNAEDLIERVLERTPGAIERVAGRLPKGFPEQVAQSIFTGIKASAEALARMPPG